MAQTVGDITKQLASVFNLEKAAGWDPIGLEFGDPSTKVATIAVCHEVTPAVVDRLIESGVDMAVTYHPLLFKPARRLISGATASGRAHRLISHGIALLSVHTAFDVAKGGTADSLAAALGLAEVTGFGPAWGSETSKVITFVPPQSARMVSQAMADAGGGTIGQYSGCSFRSAGVGSFLPSASAEPTMGESGMANDVDEIRIEMVTAARRVNEVVAAIVAAHPYEEPAFDVIGSRSNAGFIGRHGSLPTPSTVDEIAALVSDRLGGVLRVAGSGAVNTVAVIPGSGGSMLGSVDADVVVTGDVSHHQARDATSRGLSVIDPGHAATERPGVQALYASVAEMIGNTIDMTEVDSDPWKER